MSVFVRRWILSVVILVVLGAMPGATAAARPTGLRTQPSAQLSSEAGNALPAPDASGDVVLSNETTFTRWTTAVTTAPARAQPAPHARPLARLRFLTSDGFLQSYIALRQRSTPHGLWVQVRLPMRPNGRTGWVPRSALDGFQLVTTEIVLDRAARRLQLFRDGNVILTAPIGVGKPSTPTPPGHFWITEKFAVHNQPVYGPFAFGTSDYSSLTDWPGGGIVGLHGTDQPGLVPGNPSHGCVRLHNADVLRLAKLVPLGTPLLIQ